MTSVQTLEVVYGLVQNMKEVMDGEQLYWLPAACLVSFPYRQQGIEYPCSGYPRYALRATVTQLRV